MEVVAFEIGNVWSHYLWPVIQLVIGLGLVIFVHELGHFLAAKWAGIKVEEFALGFGKKLWGRRKGETEYRINALPLGGYVKMLGQDDFKPTLETPADPRAWQATPVGKRLVVLSAGVAMNVVFAAVLFVAVCLVGIEFAAPVVGSVAPGYPAEKAEIVWQDDPPDQAQAASGQFSTQGLQPGDRILKVDDKRITHFDQISLMSLRGGRGKVHEMTIERRFDGKKRIGVAKIKTMAMESELAGKRPHFGIAPAEELTFDKVEDWIFTDPFQADDRVLALNGRPVRYGWDLEPIQETLDGQPVTVAVQRDEQRLEVRISPRLSGGKLDDVVYHEGSRVYGKIASEDAGELVLRLEDGSERTFAREGVVVGKDEPLDILGMGPRLKVLAVEKDSPADKAGLRPGDIIAGYGDQGTPTLRQFLDINEQVADSGTDVVVLRDGELMPPTRILPAKHMGRARVGILPTGDQDHTVVAGVRPGSAAEAAGIRSGDEITQINGQPVATWLDVYHRLSDLAGQDVSITYRRGSATATAEIGPLTEEKFDPEDYTFNIFSGVRPFKMLVVAVRKRNPLAAVVWGLGETRDFIVTTYATLRGLLSGDVSGKALHGPVGIGGVAIRVGRQSFIRLVYLMAIIGVSIAVINFLPLPVLDGGLVVLVLIEKIRGRPLPLKVQAAIQVVGFVLIIGAFVALTWNDIARWIQQSW